MSLLHRQKEEKEKEYTEILGSETKDKITKQNRIVDPMNYSIYNTQQRGRFSNEALAS